MTTTEPISTDDRAAWLEARKTFIGGSEVGAVLGLSPWAVPIDVWADKHGMVPAKAETIAMALGNELEDFIARRWLSCDDTGRYAIDAGEGTLRLDGHPHIAATPDRKVWDGERGAHVGLLECKLVGSHMRSHWTDEHGEHRPPLYVESQAQLQLAVTGLPWCDVCSLHADGWDFRVHRVHRDDATTATIVDLLDQWWDRHIVNGERPELDGRPDKVAKALEQIYADADDTMPPAVADDNLAACVIELGRLKALKREISDDIERIENDIKAALTVRTKLVQSEGAKPIATWTSEQRRRIDTDALKTLHPDIAKECTRTTTTRVLRTYPQRVEAPF
jgi:putative phage-type endonuclease